MTKKKFARGPLFLLLAVLSLLVPSLAEAACSISCPGGYCMTGQEPSTCCCDFFGDPHCGVFDDYPCGGAFASVTTEEGTPTAEGFLAFLAQSEDAAE